MEKSTTEKFLTIHGHFYQPPRENPWLEAIEVQDSATPFLSTIGMKESAKNVTIQTRYQELWITKTKFLIL